MKKNMRVRFLRCFIALSLSITFAHFAVAKSTSTQASKDRHGFYLGPSVGYGSTDWSFLTTDKDSAAAVSSPIAAKDKGAVFGGIIGYQFNNYFALEASYMHFSTSKITFAPYSAYWPLLPTKKTIESRTQQYAMYMKLMLPLHVLGETSLFSGVGLEVTHRSDELVKRQNNLGGIFNVGLLHYFTKHIGAEVAFSYSTGAGRSETEPAFHYIPFLYQGHLAIFYMF